MPDLQYTLKKLADIYDLGNSGAEDRDFFVALAGEPLQDILDLGCGTGLVCNAFATGAHRVVGVDPATAMLDVARRKPFGDKITWIESTAETFRTEQRFDLIIMTGHAFQVLLTEAAVLATLDTMKRHLKPNGQAVFESRNPAIDWDKTWARQGRLRGPEGPITATHRTLASSPAAATISFAWDYDFGEEVVSSESTLWFLSHEQIIAYADQSGLELVDLFGDWDASPFDQTSSREMIFKFKLKGQT
ncbi:MAG: class I SAM-dependent methyltransferase [Henriciella sp.]|nr:class I SAM-dependent methyltransferase [Henriciella sp.]